MVYNRNQNRQHLYTIYVIWNAMEAWQRRRLGSVLFIIPFDIFDDENWIRKDVYILSRSTTITNNKMPKMYTCAVLCWMCECVCVQICNFALSFIIFFRGITSYKYKTRKTNLILDIQIYKYKVHRMTEMRGGGGRGRLISQMIISIGHFCWCVCVLFRYLNYYRCMFRTVIASTHQILTSL